MNRALYQFALTIYPCHPKFPARGRCLRSRADRGPSDTLRSRHIVGDGAYIDDTHGSVGCLLRSVRENGKKELGEIEMAYGSHV